MSNKRVLLAYSGGLGNFFEMKNPFLLIMSYIFFYYVMICHDFSMVYEIVKNIQISYSKFSFT